MFEPLPDKFEYPDLEKDVLSFWEEQEIFSKSLRERQGQASYTFYEGPPTANGRPGIHHVLARTLKDLMCRYKTMNGYQVLRKAGWDTHGLPVELSVERELGITEKKQIEEYGIQRFNDACKDYVLRNISQSGGWTEATRRMGYWVDMDNAYITFENDYVESVWWAIKQFFDKGLIYKGFKISPQSPTLETALSSHEVSLGYKDVRDPSTFIKLRLSGAALPALNGASMLVWTTTPWTLIANVALAVGSDLDYVLVRNTRKLKRGDSKIEQVDRLILAEGRLSVLDGEVEIEERFKGADLVGARYEQIFPFVDLQPEQHPNALSVLPGDFVSLDDGSGIVHMAPAFGADDYELSRRYKLPLVQPVTPGGRFTAEAGDFAGRTVKTFEYNDHTEEGADKDIVIALKKADKLYRSSNDYLHSYPHCWRTGNPLIYYARSSWFIKSPDYKERMMELNGTIRWQPPEIGAGRFGNWLEDVKEWSLSRDRYWGTPLPIWVSEDGDDMFAVGSIAELREGLIEDENGSLVPLATSEEEIDLHRPFVDRIVFRRNGKLYRRTSETIDVWFDSGSMPFAQWHYPFENKENFERNFPADFIAEGIDQTRGWFYTLHNIATVLFDKPAFKGIIVNDLILDKEGQKMSKSKGNMVNPFEVMESLGADAVRWYMLVNNPPWKPTQFSREEIARTVIADFFRSVTNVYAFFALYANIDGFTGQEAAVPVAARPEIDRWILSKLNSVLRSYRRFMDEFEVTRAYRQVQEFMINDVSNWYVRRNRRRFWKGEVDQDKLAAYQTLRQVQITTAAMMAPAAPFLPETIYRRLRMADEPLSLHLMLLPQPAEELIDSDLESRMESAQQIVFLARSLREKSKIKTRQPLRRILVPVSSPADRRRVQSVEDIITEEINIKGIDYVSDDTGIVRKSAKPNFPVLGKKFGKETKSIAASIRQMVEADIRALESEGKVAIEVNGRQIDLEPEDVEILHEDIEGWLVASQNSLTVALDTELDKELINEGLAREFVSRIQHIRKDSGFEVTDRVKIDFKGAPSISDAINAMKAYICAETLCEHLETVDSLSRGTDLSINGESIMVAVERMTD